MPRQLKPQLVDTLRHASGITVPIMLDRNELTFHAKYGDHTICEKSAEDVTRKMREYLTSHTKMEWIPVISVQTEFTFDNDNKGSVRCIPNRYYVAKFPSNYWHSITWEDYSAEPETGWGEPNVDAMRIRRSRALDMSTDYTVLPAYGSRRHDSLILPYTDGTWLALTQIEAGIEALKAKLKETLNTPAGLKKLEAVGASMTKLLK